MKRFACMLIDGYRLGISSFLHVLGGPGCGCRFVPSCSEYAREAIELHGVWRGGWLALCRILRCHPWGRWGYDPVPGSHPETPLARGEGKVSNHFSPH